MSPPTYFPLVAVDVGNHRAKFGLFPSHPRNGLPSPSSVFSMSGMGADFDRLAEWLVDESPCLSWWIGSVNRPAAARIVQWLVTNRPEDRIKLVDPADLPLAVALAEPKKVGIDRLLDAVAANQLRDPARPAVMVDAGTAITVDLISSEGTFLGGAILPGRDMASRALHTFTDLLPLVDTTAWTSPPPALGESTLAAIQSGIFWGAVGAVRELIARLTADLPGPVDVFVTGGGGSVLQGPLGPNARYVADLALAGIAVSAHQTADGIRDPI